MDCFEVLLWYVPAVGLSSPSKAIQQSGSAYPLHDIASASSQENYDFIVAQTNCSTANDTLTCLRQAPYEALVNAMSHTPYLASYQSLNITWSPLVDGVILKHTLQESLRIGKYASVGWFSGLSVFDLQFSFVGASDFWYRRRWGNVSRL